MKKLIILTFGLIIMGFSACKKVTEQYYTTPNQTIFYDINSSSWTSSNANFTYKATLNFLQGDSYLNTYDGILVYISYDGGTNFISVPQTYNGLAYSFSVNNNKVLLEVQSSDYNTAIANPGAMFVKIVLIPSAE